MGQLHINRLSRITILVWLPCLEESEESRNCGEAPLLGSSLIKVAGVNAQALGESLELSVTAWVVLVSSRVPEKGSR